MAIIYIQRCLFSKYKRSEAYIFKCDILVIALFAMFSSNSKYQAIPVYYIVYFFNHFQVYLAASRTCKCNTYVFIIPLKNSYGCIGIFGDIYIVDDYI